MEKNFYSYSNKREIRMNVRWLKESLEDFDDDMEVAVSSEIV